MVAQGVAEFNNGGLNPNMSAIVNGPWAKQEFKYLNPPVAPTRPSEREADCWSLNGREYEISLYSLLLQTLIRDNQHEGNSLSNIVGGQKFFLAASIRLSH